jgi:hypothetical protein
MMKRKRFLSIGVGAAAAMAAALVLAGCATTGGSGDGGGNGIGGGDAPMLAARLAADINAAHAGSAEAEGDTVVLSGGVRLGTALAVPEGVTLTVPEGVTLDLTADGAALTLGNGAVLTVDGAVNARAHVWKGAAGSLLFDRAAAINGSGSINLKSKGELLCIGKNQKLTLDGVTLAGLEDNDDSLVMVYDGGELVMISGAITGNTRIGEGWAAGGGVQVDNSTFTMQGGTVSGNIVKGGKQGYGGGVYVTGGATFTMSGGGISGNIVDGGGDWSNGGGVNIEGGSTFTMSGGEISGNTVINGNDSAGGGGGVLADCSIFTMKGGTISGNRVTASYSSGGGVYVIGGEKEKNGAFIMEGGAVFGNSTISPINRAMSGGVDVRYGTFTMKGGRIQGSTDSDGFTKNSVSYENSAALFVWDCAAKWGTGGTYTRGGVSQAGGSDIVPIDADSGGSTNDTLIAIPAK